MELEEIHNKINRLEKQLYNLEQLPKTNEVESLKSTITQTINEYNKKLGEDTANNQSGLETANNKSSANDYQIRQNKRNISKNFDLINNNSNILKQIVSHFTDNKLLNIGKDISSMASPEFDKTLHIMSGKKNYKGDYFIDVDIKDEKDKDTYILIDKVLRDLHYFDLEKYKQISNEFPKSDSQSTSKYSKYINQ
jgi:hypothetical protein